MLKWLPQNIPSVSLPSLFAGARKGTNKLLPAPSAKTDLPQLPIPRTPFDRYRLQKLLRKLNLATVNGRSVLEVGCGVGDLLLEIAKHQPKEIYGVERKQDNVNYARKALKAAKVEAHLIAIPSYKYLHFPDKSFDYVFVMHEFDGLQHDKLVEEVVKEVSRVSRQWIVLVEETAEKFTKRRDKTLRTAQFYKELFLQQRLPHRKEGHQRRKDYDHQHDQKNQENQQEQSKNEGRQTGHDKRAWQNKQAGHDRRAWQEKQTGGGRQWHSKRPESDNQEVEYKEEHRFYLRKVEYLDVKASRYIFTGRSNPWHWIRWFFSPLLWLLGFPSRLMRPPVAESELPDSSFAMKLQEKLLPLTAGLDDIFTSNSGITMMWFEREKLFRRG